VKVTLARFQPLLELKQKNEQLRLLAAVAQLLQEVAGFTKLFGSRALCEVAADDDKIGLQAVELGLDLFDQPLIVRAEMEIGKMDYASHDL